jgi:hypothetical protein
MKVTAYVDIACPAGKVWEWLGSPEKAMAWQTDVSKTEMLDEKPGMVGSTFRETVADESGSTEMRGMITGWEQNRLLSMHLEGDYNVVDMRWSLEDLGERTRLTADSDIRFKGKLGVVSVLLGPGFRKKIRA